jgi:hypothetical protein
MVADHADGLASLPAMRMTQSCRAAKKSSLLNVPGFTSWAPPGLTLNNSFLGFPTGFAFNVNGDLTINGTNACLVVKPTDAYSCANLTITNGGQLRIYGGPTNGTPGAYGSLINAGNRILIGAGSWIYPYADYTNGGAPLIRCERLYIENAAGINADSAGFFQDAGPGKGGQGVGGGGAAHGGIGGTGTWSGAYVMGNTNTYDMTNAPVAPGSGGGSYLPGTVGERGGLGGGMVRVEAGTDISIYGVIRANGEAARNASGGGAGGTILLASGGAIYGNPASELRAEGGNGYFSSPAAWGGGGGRIALWHKVPGDRRPAFYAGNFTDAIITNSYAQFQGQVFLDGGSGYQAGSNGTIAYLSVIPRPGTILSIW